MGSGYNCSHRNTNSIHHYNIFKRYKMKNVIYIITIVALVIVFFLKNNKLKTTIDENSILKNSIDSTLHVIDSISNVEKENSLVIDSLMNEREKVKIIYKTIYKEYEHKDSIVNSFTVVDIQDYWTNKYKD